MIISNLEELKEAVITLDKDKAYIIRIDPKSLTDNVAKAWRDLLSKYKEQGYNVLLIAADFDIYELTKE